MNINLPGCSQIISTMHVLSNGICDKEAQAILIETIKNNMPKMLFENHDLSASVPRAVYIVFAEIE